MNQGPPGTRMTWLTAQLAITFCPRPKIDERKGRRQGRRNGLCSRTRARRSPTSAYADPATTVVFFTVAE